MVLPIIPQVLMAIALWCQPMLSPYTCRQRMQDCVHPESGETIGSIEKRLWACAAKENK